MILGKISYRAAFAVVLLTVPPCAKADMIDTEGMAPWEVCGLCHGYDGQSAMAKFPRLAGQKAAYIEKQLADIASGARSNEGGQMRSIMEEIAVDDYEAIAAWFASQPPPPPDEAEGDTALGERLWKEHQCAGCHLNDQETSGMIAPHLSAQHARYLKKQLTDFRDGERTNDPDSVMRAMTAKLGDEEIDALAAFLAASERAPKDDQ